LFTDPAEVGILQADMGHVVIAVRVETSGDEHHFRLETLQRRQP